MGACEAKAQPDVEVLPHNRISSLATLNDGRPLSGANRTAAGNSHNEPATPEQKQVSSRGFGDDVRNLEIDVSSMSVRFIGSRYFLPEEIQVSNVKFQSSTLALGIQVTFDVHYPTLESQSCKWHLSQSGLGWSGLVECITPGATSANVQEVTLTPMNDAATLLRPPNFGAGPVASLDRSLSSDFEMEELPSPAPMVRPRFRPAPRRTGGGARMVKVANGRAGFDIYSALRWDEYGTLSQ